MNGLFQVSVSGDNRWQTPAGGERDQRREGYGSENKTTTNFIRPKYYKKN